MQFQVPQFIEVEDKIFGPLTFKQFIYVAGGTGLAYIVYRLLPQYIGVPLGLASLGAGAALAFVQWNGRPFIVGVESAFFYFIRSKLYLWNNERRTRTEAIKKAEEAARAPEIYVPKLTENRLSQLAWNLDINERIAAGTVSDAERDRVASAASIVAPVRTARSALMR
jgi:hypothetical protein